jgi:hypothetical protein
MDFKKLAAGGLALGTYAALKLDAAIKAQDRNSPYHPDSWSATEPGQETVDEMAYLAEKEREANARYEAEMRVNPQVAMRKHEQNRRDADFLMGLSNLRHQTAMQMIRNIR